MPCFHGSDTNRPTISVCAKPISSTIAASTPWVSRHHSYGIRSACRRIDRTTIRIRQMMAVDSAKARGRFTVGSK